MFLKKKTKNQMATNVDPKKMPFYRRRGWKIFFIVLIVLLLTAAFFAYYLLRSGSKVFEGGISASGLIKTINGTSETLRGQSGDRINVLVVGMGGPNHPGGLLTDSIMVLSIQPKEKRVAMLSIPRDLYVPIDGHGSDKINAAFADGYNDYLSKSCKQKSQSNCVKDAMTSGANLSLKTVSNVTGLDIPYYFTIQFKGFEELIDSLGGIDVTVDKAIYDPMFPADDMVHYAPFKMTTGLHHMDGATALKFARSRETSSDFDRAARQQKIILAIKEKAEKASILTDPKKVLDIFSSLTDSFYTNFSPVEIKSLAEVVRTVDTKNPITKVLSDESGGPLVSVNDGTYYLKAKAGNFSEIQNIAKNIFNIKQSAKIELINTAKLTSAQMTVVHSGIEKNTEYGLSVINSYVGKTTLAKSIIYDYTDGSKTAVASYLADQFGADVVKKNSGSNGSIDFSISIGQNYKVQ